MTNLGQGDGLCGYTGNEIFRGCDLFNEGRFFEAHEIWEEAWRATSRPEKQTIQGMVQIAAALHHFSRGNLVGASSLMKRGLQNLEGCGDDFRGLDINQLREDVRSAIQQLEQTQIVTAFPISRVREQH